MYRQGYQKTISQNKEPKMTTYIINIAFTTFNIAFYCCFFTSGVATKLESLQLSVHTQRFVCITFRLRRDLSMVTRPKANNSTIRHELDLTQYATSFTSALVTVSSRFWPTIAAELRQQNFRGRSRSRCLPHLGLLNQSISACMLSTERNPNRKKNNINSKIKNIETRYLTILRE